VKLSVEEIAKIIATNYCDWQAYIGKAQKVIDYIEKEKRKDMDLFLK